MSNDLDSVQIQHSVGSDLSTTCLKKLSADNKIHKKRVNKNISKGQEWTGFKSPIRSDISNLINHFTTFK